MLKRSRGSLFHWIFCWWWELNRNQHEFNNYQDLSLVATNKMAAAKKQIGTHDSTAKQPIMWPTESEAIGFPPCLSVAARKKFRR